MLSLVVSAGKKKRDEKTGKAIIEGREKDIANEITAVLKERFQEQGWIN